MKNKEYLEKRDRKFAPSKESNNESLGGGKLFGLVGGIALLGVAALVIVALPDIKRYIRISTM